MITSIPEGDEQGTIQIALDITPLYGLSKDTSMMQMTCSDVCEVPSAHISPSVLLQNKYKHHPGLQVSETAPIPTANNSAFF